MVIALLSLSRHYGYIADMPVYALCKEGWLAGDKTVAGKTKSKTKFSTVFGANLQTSPTKVNLKY